MDLEDQENELLALESILDSTSFTYNNLSGEIKIHANLNYSVLKITSPTFENIDGSNISQNYEVEHLPPFTLSFTYPPSYPSVSPPDYTLSCIWLSRFQLNALCDQLDEIWETQEGSVILYSWFQFLQDESLEHLGITDSLKIECSKVDFRIPMQKALSNSDSAAAEELSAEVKKYNRVVQDVRSKEEIVPLILHYNETKKQETFNQSSFPCPICFEDKVGSRCMQFSGCDHVYCKECIVSYFSIQIKDGNVKELKCPTEKCNGQPLPKKIQELVDPNLYERYEKLLLQTTLDTMEDVIYCPLLHCQSPVIVDGESDFAQCPTCSYAFCPYCKLSYHGVSKCKIASHEMRLLCDRYETADPSERFHLEKRYGKKVIATAIEESKTDAWMKTNTKPCPSCDSSIEKLDGCNKMTCYKCKAYFCWLCLSLLDLSNPYHHYNNPKSPCFNKLFEGAILDEEFEMWI